MAGKKVIIRTLDIGADKQVDYFELDKEENPALGYRAIRICLTRQEVFKTQLRAIYRASHYGTVAIMFPMIISLDEVKKCKNMAELVQRELESEGIPFGDVELGIMIETPAAVMISDELAWPEEAGRLYATESGRLFAEDVCILEEGVCRRTEGVAVQTRCAEQP